MLERGLVRRRVVITGIGVISPNGLGAPAFRDACLAGRSGLKRPDPELFKGLKTSAVGAVHGFDPLTVMESAEIRRVPRLVPMAIAAGREALSQAGLTIGHDDLALQRSIGVALGTGGGGLGFLEDQYKAFFGGGQASLFSITSGTHGNLSSELSIAMKLRGPSHVLSTGCTSSTDAIGYAAMVIRDGRARAMLAGGADSPITPGILACFEKMRVVSTRRWDDPAQSSRPFSADRDGFVLGEGAWMLLLEDAESAVRRGAAVLAEIAGYGSTCDAFHRVQIAPDVVEPARAIHLALQEAGVTAQDVDHVNLHGTGTLLNDLMETRAIKLALGERAGEVPMSSTKSMIGHPQGACGAAGIAAAILCGRAGRVHPTVNLNSPDPECNLDYVPNTAREAARLRHILCNCIAFGSKNSALLLRLS